jgi:hypothetical protein
MGAIGAESGNVPAVRGLVGIRCHVWKDTAMLGHTVLRTSPSAPFPSFTRRAVSVRMRSLPCFVLSLQGSHTARR